MHLIKGWNGKRKYLRSDWILTQVFVDERTKVVFAESGSQPCKSNFIPRTAGESDHVNIDTFVETAI